MDKINLLTKVQVAVDAIKNGTAIPIVEPGDGLIYSLDISRAYLGTIIYTRFDLTTLLAIDTLTVRFSHAHVFGQLFYGAIYRTQTPPIIDSLPGTYLPVTYDPGSIIPRSY